MLVLLAAAMPVRLPLQVPVANSVSVLDLLLIAALVTFYLDLPWRRLDLGHPPLAAALAVPPAACALSILWSQDRVETARTLVMYVEAFVAYLFVTRELEGLPATRVIAYIRRYAWLVTLPAVLLILRVPGFAPAEPELSPTSADYVSYYTRLSHPVLGRSNSLATVLAILVPPLLYWGHTRRDRRATLAGVLALTAVVCTLSRGVIVAFAVAGLGYGALLRRPAAAPRRPVLGKVVAVTFGLAAGASALYELNPTTREFIGSRFNPTNVLRREDLYAIAFEKIAIRPVLGYGAGVVPDSDAALTVDVHNTYVQQLLYFGLPLGVLVGVVVAGLPVVFLARRRVDPLAGAVGYAVLVEVISFAFESSFEGTVLRVLFYLTVGLLAGLLRAAEANGARAGPTTPERDSAGGLPQPPSARPGARSTP
jgi:O-antigen ligase